MMNACIHKSLYFTFHLQSSNLQLWSKMLPINNERLVFKNLQQAKSTLVNKTKKIPKERNK